MSVRALFVPFRKGEKIKLLELRKFTLLCISSLFIILLIGCQSMNQFSPEQVIANALETDKDVTYYGEIEMSVEGIDEMEEIKIQEWRKDEKVRLEMTSDTEAVTVVLDGESALVVNESEKTAFLSALAYEINPDELYLNPQEQIELLLEIVQDTHDIETIGEETVAGRETIHMSAKKRDGEKSLYGDQELWIDKENWLLLKAKSISGDVQVNMEYTKIDFDMDIDDRQFELDIPDGVEVHDMEDISQQDTEISLDEIPEKLEQPVLIIPDHDLHQIDKITFYEMDGEFAYQDVTIDYKRNDGLPLMSLTLFKGDGNEELSEEEREALGEIEEYVQIRDVEGHFIDEEQFRNVSWTENGIHYSIHMIDPSTTLEDVQKWAEEMKEIK